MKKNSCALFLILSFSIFSPKAQDHHIIDSLRNELHKYDSYKKEIGSHANPLMDSIKANLLYGLALQYWAHIFDTAIDYTQQVLVISKQIGYRKGIGNAYNGMGLINMQMKNYAVSLDYYQKALIIRTEIGDKSGMAWTYNDLGLLYGNQGNYEEAIRYHLKSICAKQEIGDKVGIASSYGKIGHLYVSVGKFSEGVGYFFDALKIGEQDSDRLQIEGSYNDIGDVYYKQGEYTEALKNYRNESKIASERGVMTEIAMSESNVGRVLFKMDNDTGAIKYLFTSLSIYKKELDITDASDVYYNLGLVYLAMGKYSLALSNADSSLKGYQTTMGYQIDIARVFIEIGSIYEKMNNPNAALDVAVKGLSIATHARARIEMRDACFLLACINAEMQNFEEAYKYYEEYVANLDSVNNSEGVKKITTLEMDYGFRKKEDSVRVEEEKSNIIRKAEINRKSIITNSAIVISILTILMAILLINRQQLKHKKNRVIFEKDKQRMESELMSSKTILDEYTQSMAEKNKLLEEFKSEVEEFKSLHDKERTENIEYLNKATILTDEDWNKFKLLFEQVYKDFFNRLKGKLPDLTQAEIRLVCLTKLSIGTKQMAGILGVSDDTIKKSRHRLRKKLGLTEDHSLDDVVNSI